MQQFFVFFYRYIAYAYHSYKYKNKTYIMKVIQFLIKKENAYKDGNHR